MQLFYCKSLAHYVKIDMFTRAICELLREGGVSTMSKVCEVCGKGKMSGNIVTFSKRHIRRTWTPNIQKVRVVVDGTPRRMNVCTRCLRSGKVARA